ncbi:MAG: ArsC family reductase [Gammaproteobacteria bacterium]|nr:ArsC family reductase [Gammaproteobacteria bacterium]MCK5262139.1 ArsC family reductase [Gammaproteobacteria bacterium]
MATTLFGIPNCDTMKKARRWLEANDVTYIFHDYKKAGVPEDELKLWIKTIGWEILLNRRGTTWRKLDDSVKENIDKVSAIQVMIENPSAIKRPVLEIDDQLLVGFSEDTYKEAFNK